jgi:hypothetical protein
MSVPVGKKWPCATPTAITAGDQHNNHYDDDEFASASEHLDDDDDDVRSSELIWGISGPSVSNNTNMTGRNCEMGKQ